MLVNDGRLRERAKVSLGGESMPRSSRTDEELGKRDDEYKPTTSTWPFALRLRRRRIALGLVAAFFVWLFIHNIPTDLGSIDQRMGRPMRPGREVNGLEFGYRPPAQPAAAPNRGAGGQSIKAPTGPPPRDSDTASEDDHYYWGPIRFFNLASSLHQMSRSRGHGANTRNILFAASNLKSASNILPMACSMHAAGRNFVHFVLMGRDSLPMDDFLAINGVDRETCNIGFHDGRPDYSDYSSDPRAEVSVSGALGHIETFMNPKVIITDDSAIEDFFFTKGVRIKAKELDRPVIEVPAGKYEDFLWMTRLDCSSLQSWHKPSINILIHAPPHSSGSLLRVLDSLKEADYAGLVPPQLTIDLPVDIEPFARDHIRDMTWPPPSDKSAGIPQHNSVILHHRLSSAQATTESNAMRLLEAFYPSNTDHSHVLLLSAQAELSPLFYHYLLYSILEYHYSYSAAYNSDRLVGLALSSPQFYLDGRSPFKSPAIKDLNGRKAESGGGKAGDDEEAIPFLWQAPNADATLIFGDKWAEFHDYLKNRLRAAHEPAALHQPPIKTAKVISETQPGWLEYMLELMRARGWTLLYPAARESGSLVTVHKELYQPPEEFVKPPVSRKQVDETEKPLPDPSEPFLSGEVSPPSESPREQRNVVQHSQPLHAILPFDGELPGLPNMASMTYSGEIVASHVLQNMLWTYKEQLRAKAGGCTLKQAGLNRPYVSGRADDLFCFLDQDLDDEETAEQVAGPPTDVETTSSTVSKAAKAPEAKLDIGKSMDAETDKAVPVLDSTAKQKQAYAKALGLSEDQPTEEKPKPPPMKAVVEDLGKDVKDESEI